MSEIRCLLCDDDPDMLGLLTRRLAKMGLEHDVAEDGRRAKAFVDEHTYDVIITDIYMPEATGLELLQYAKQKDRDVQVVIITSAATLENAIDALNHGAFGYLTKPFDHLIVFDNMVTRAVEYRHLLVASKHKAEAQKRRGDMLEDEVAERVQQLQKKQKGLLDLLAALPDGILVVEEGGRVVLSSPVGERWLARDERTEQSPIRNFISQVNAAGGERRATVTVDERELTLLAVDFPADGQAERKAVLIREVEASKIGAGSLVTDTVGGIKKVLATLYQQGVATEAVLDLAQQFAVLEQLAGWVPAGRPIAPRPIHKPAEESPDRPQAQTGPRLNTAQLAEALSAASKPQPEPSQPAEPALPPGQSEELPLEEPEVGSPEPPLAASKTVEPAASVSAAPDPAAEPAAEAGPEPAFPKAQPGTLDPQAKPIDTGLFRPRIIPEAMSAKLGEPPPVQPSNGKGGAIRIGSSAANTRIFRKVLEKMSGEKVIGPGDPEAGPDAGGDQTAARPSEAEEPEATPAIGPDRTSRRPPARSEPARVPEPALQAAIASRPARPEPKKVPPVPAPAEKAAPGWPPKLPSTDPDWDDALETGD